jgi:hypothetical protein
MQIVRLDHAQLAMPLGGEELVRAFYRATSHAPLAIIEHSLRSTRTESLRL